MTGDECVFGLPLGPRSLGDYHGTSDAGDSLPVLSFGVLQVSDLGTTILGLETGGVITINETAAGYNWYVNAGSSSSRAFGLAGPDGESLAGPGSPAANDVDLVTVLEHELGHVLGLPDNDQAGDLMDITLGLGVRRAPGGADLAAIGSASKTHGVINVSAGVVVRQPQSFRSTGLVTPATGDAALAAMLVPAGGNGNGHNSAAIDESAGQGRGTNLEPERHTTEEKAHGPGHAFSAASFGRVLVTVPLAIDQCLDPKRSSGVS